MTGYHPRTRRPGGIEAQVMHARNLMRDDDDAVYAVCGDTGSGKSSLAFLLAHAMQDQPFNVHKQIVWTEKDLEDCSRTLPEFSVIWADETSTVGGNRRRSMSTDNVELQNHLNTCRAFHQSILFCQPEFADLDMAIQTRCRGIFHCYQRGKVRYLELVKDSDPMSREVYPVERWRDAFPNPETHVDPEKRERWVAYQALKKQFSHQGSDKKAPLARGFVQSAREKIRLVLDERGIPRP